MGCGVMARYIDADKLIAEYDRVHVGPPGGARKLMEEAPAADVVEVKRGKWIKRGNEKKCSVCEFIYYSNNDEWNFCPNCGAKMDGGKAE